MQYHAYYIYFYLVVLWSRIYQYMILGHNKYMTVDHNECIIDHNTYLINTIT